jgi:hypothetical protein
MAIRFIEENEYTKGETADGTKYFEFDSHLTRNGQKKYIRVTPAVIDDNGEVYTVNIQERVGESLGPAVEIPVGCLPALMNVFVDEVLR